MPVVVLSGMRQTGKSTLLLRDPALAERRYVSLDDMDALETLRRNPSSLVSESRPVTIDEVQRFPDILFHIKRSIDRDRRPGRFLLSGSANLLLLRNVGESLAGRAVYLALHPFTRREILSRTAETPALVEFLNTGRFPDRRLEPVSQENIALGGMPAVCLRETGDPSLWFRGYEQTYIERDIRLMSNIGDTISFRTLLRLAALRTGQVLNQSQLARDAKMSTATAGRHLSLMEASFLISRLQPHRGNSASRLIKSPKLFFSDSGLAWHLADAGRPESAAARGPFWENYIVQNVCALLSCRLPDARATYWNVQGRHEVDLVIEIGNETVAIEIKSGSRWDEGDLAGLKAYLRTAPRCRAAILAYNGRTVLDLGERILAVPLSLLIS